MSKLPPSQGIVEALRALQAAFAKLQCPAMVIGGLAAICHGVPRVTRDIDCTLPGDGLDYSELLGVLAECEIRPRIDDAVPFAREAQVLLLVHTPSGVEIDMSFAWMQFELDALDQAVVVDLVGNPIKVARPEDLVIYKVVAWRAQDRQDIERLLRVHGGAVDIERVRRSVAQIAEILEDPDRVAEFEEILATVGLTAS